MQQAAQEILRAPEQEQDAAIRQNLVSVPSWAIDSAETTEVDDAIGIETLPDGRKKIWVHIADPTAWMSPNSPLTKEAMRRTSTLYIPTGKPAYTLELINKQDGWTRKLRAERVLATRRKVQLTALSPYWYIVVTKSSCGNHDKPSILNVCATVQKAFTLSGTPCHSFLIRCLLPTGIKSSTCRLKSLEFQIY